MKSSVRVLTLACVALISALALAAKKPPEEWDGLKLVKVKGIDAAYVRPGADISGYTKVIIDPIQVAFAKDSNTGVQSRFRRVGVLAVDRHLTNPPEESARQSPLQAGRREVLRLGEEGHPPGHHHGHEERVAERQVIAGENCGALTRHIIQPLRPRAPYRAQERADGDIFQETVEHGPPPLARPSRVTARPQA